MRISKINYFLIVAMMYGCSKHMVPINSATETGSGKILFSVSAMATYKRYLEARNAREFVVTEDGKRGFYTYCTDAVKEECSDYKSSQLLDYCFDRTRTVCKVFAKAGQVVWENPGQWKTEETVGMHFFVDHKGVRVDSLGKESN